MSVRGRAFLSHHISCARPLSLSLSLSRTRSLSRGHALFLRAYAQCCLSLSASDTFGARFFLLPLRGVVQTFRLIAIERHALSNLVHMCRAKHGLATKEDEAHRFITTLAANPQIKLSYKLESDLSLGAVFWVSHEQLSSFSRFGQIIQIDCTHKLNRCVRAPFSCRIHGV